MKPNWFIGLRADVGGLLGALPTPPPRVRLFDAADHHMTLAFLGAVGEAAAIRAWQTLEEGSPPVIDATFGTMHEPPHPKRASALFALLAPGPSDDAAKGLIARHRGPMQSAAGARLDTRPPLPHVTLARIQRRATLEERHEALRWCGALPIEGAPVRFDALVLYTWSDDRSVVQFKAVETRALGAGEASAQT